MANLTVVNMTAAAMSNRQHTQRHKSLLTRLPVGWRIGLGFSTALGIAFVGTLTGIFIGEYYERKSQAVLAEVTIQSQLILQAEASLYDSNLYQRELAYLVDNPDALASSITGFRTRAEDFYKTFRQFQSVYYDTELTPEESAAYAQLMESYGSFVRPYFRTMQLQLLQIESLSLTPSDSPDRETNRETDKKTDREIARTLLLEAGSETSLLEAHNFIDSLQALADILEAERVEATTDLAKTSTLRRNIIASSLMLSLAISGALAYVISRSIVRPLRLVEQVAKDVTERDRFDLQAPITTDDEVATLATALNQLIDRVRSLLATEAKRTQALTQANEEILSTQTQMIAQEKLASLGSLTAGIAHEIKNPLNFVNNFAELSGELVDELEQEIADQPTLNAEFVEELSDIIALLKFNVSKIEHHGKRADKIVSNMLMHSRSGKIEWSQININDLLAEAINLAYHGMRAKHSTFNLEFDTDYADNIPEISGCAQDLNRVFLNIVNNACYAIYQRQLSEEQHAEKQSQDSAFKPLLKVRTREQPACIEITIRDNGIGIPPEVKRKIFEQFFTTKPTGEGTGLGLSLSHDIIAQQHKGTLSVDSEVGVFTDFVITLPKQRPASA